MWKRSTHSCADQGFTLVELLVGMTVALLVTAAAFTLALSSRSLYDADRARVRSNESLRTAFDFLGADVRQAGERLGDDFPAIEVIDGDDGPDTLILRRNLLSEVLRVCQAVEGTQQEISIGDRGGTPPPGCAPVPDDDGNGWPENLQVWREHRLSHGGTVRAFIYDPVIRVGEFFTYDAEDTDELVLRTAPGTVWNLAYTPDNQARVYLLEERRYELEDGLLRLFIDGDRLRPVHLVDDLNALSIEALLRDGSRRQNLGPADSWTQLIALDIKIAAITDSDERPVIRRRATRLVPRNVLSRH